jgi:hypothetical protein
MGIARVVVAVVVLHQSLDICVVTAVNMSGLIQIINPLQKLGRMNRLEPNQN